MKCLLALALVTICALSVSAKLQNVTVTGVAVCQKKRLANQRVHPFLSVQMKCLLALALVAICALSVSAKLQNVTVTGVAVCQKKRLANQRVQLFDRDTCEQHFKNYGP
ncbi:unnamed protein product [Cylicostephanus goldi]|uniref:Uncharacterized protein n=1 Tax=Cylicostephanus goldi TaxID=71465 RepID=A0A3P7QSW0_CYLGO|nr:unnamed protein product [Cylicostephanus goldi]